MISVLIATSDRPLAIHSCLQSFQKSTVRHFEIILVDQSSNNDTKRIVRAFHDTRFIYVHERQKNKSSALNRAMTIAHGTIYCFTDDDCRINKDWLLQIERDFEANPTIDGVVGTTYPYRPAHHPKMCCLSTFQQKKYRIITMPQNHAVSIGFGNNMAWRKTACNNQFFSVWLGPHSVGAAAEDADFLLRQLMLGKKILCDPKCKIYHDNWVDQNTKRKRDLVYIQGEMVCYTHFALLGQKFAKYIIQQNFVASLKEMKKIAGDVFKRKTFRVDSWINAITTLIIRIKGLCIGMVYSIKERGLKQISSSNDTLHAR